VYKAPPR